MISRVFKANRQASSTDTELTQRKVSFDFGQSPLHWIPGDPYSSHLISAIHTLLPIPELYFCRIYNKALPYISDERLREDVKGFIRQEAVHSRAHSVGIRDYLERHGMEVATVTQKIEWMCDALLGEKPFGRTVPKVLEKRWLVLRLGMIAALEHFTCVLGAYALSNQAWDRSGADATILDILRWHGAEEVEHRSVAFDVYRHLGGNYPARYLQQLVALPLVFGLWSFGGSHLMQQDPVLAAEKPHLYRPYFWRSWYKQARETGHLPPMSWLLVQSARYFSPWYDPAKEADTAVAQAYLATSPAAQRAEAESAVLAH
ncbi:metal-dependent hydrolase [Marinobacter sp. SS21]|uniref:metal-dependent hydrolase n=1 Tax=Marinobacter sp. SS21 TaxID=2979460 RepID=UPI00233027D7|nr:metal-dependent hydrolase [Marinobacter sp. SS21]MDC0661107.1 metal-dependent hydrolase [Marinobacter sp. SS21]